MSTNWIKDPKGSGQYVSPFQGPEAGQTLRSWEKNGYPTANDIGATIVGMFVLAALFLGFVGLVAWISNF